MNNVKGFDADNPDLNDFYEAFITEKTVEELITNYGNMRQLYVNIKDQVRHKEYEYKLQKIQLKQDPQFINMKPRPQGEAITIELQQLEIEIIQLKRSRDNIEVLCELLKYTLNSKIFE